jgi:ABC-type phosphate/phosphonate transport system substrate-binding protein
MIRQIYHTNRSRLRLTLLALLAATLLVSTGGATANSGEMVLLIQPILSEEKTKTAYQPLADYLTQITGKPCVVRAMPNFFAYWDTIRRNGNYDLVLDAAHFTDYRAQKMGFKILAKIPDSVSYSIIVPEGSLVIDPAELIGKTIATLGPPSIGAARLNAMFPNPLRQPIIVEVANSDDGMKMVVEGRVHAAILPTPIVSRQMAQGGGIFVVTTTEPIPHIALSGSSNLDGHTLDKIRTALINANKTEDGKKMLEGIGFPKFDPAAADLYVGQSNILKEYWGY